MTLSTIIRNDTYKDCLTPYLPYNDCLNLKSTNWEFYKAMQAFRQHEIDRFDKNINPSVLANVSQIHHLHLNKIFHMNNKYAQFYIALIRQFTHAKSLRINIRSETLYSTILNLLKQWKGLEILFMKYNAHMSLTGVFYSFFNFTAYRLLSLTIMELSSQLDLSRFPIFPYLHTLCLREIQAKTDTFILDLRKFPALIDLEFQCAVENSICIANDNHCIRRYEGDLLKGDFHLKIAPKLQYAFISCYSIFYSLKNLPSLKEYGIFICHEEVEEYTPEIIEEIRDFVMKGGKLIGMLIGFDPHAILRDNRWEIKFPIIPHPALEESYSLMKFFGFLRHLLLVEIVIQCDFRDLREKVEWLKAKSALNEFQFEATDPENIKL